MDHPDHARPNAYLRFRDWCKRNAVVRRAVPALVRCVPDVAVTRQVPYLGRFSFSLRRQRWLLGAGAMPGHAPELGMIAHGIEPGAVLYDIGANIGYYLRFFQRYLPVQQIVAFEPMTRNVKLLHRNVQQGPAPEQVRIFEVALSDRHEREQLQIDDYSDGSAQLDRLSPGQAARGRRMAGMAGRTEWIQSMTLDELFNSEGQLPAPTVMKIDVEGAEALVLEGARGVLDLFSPHLAISLHEPEPAEASLRILDSLGYHCFAKVPDERGTVSFQKVTVDQASSLRDRNTVASRDPGFLSRPIQPLDFSKLKP